MKKQRDSWLKQKEKPYLFCRRCSVKFGGILGKKRHPLYYDYCEECGNHFISEHYN